MSQPRNVDYSPRIAGSACMITAMSVMINLRIHLAPWRKRNGLKQYLQRVSPEKNVAHIAKESYGEPECSVNISHDLRGRE